MRWVVVAILCVVVGCRKNDGRTPTEMALDRSAAEIRTSIGSGVRATADRAPFEIPVRYNPADCACPEYEIYAWGHWVRAFIDAEGEPAKTLDDLRSAGSLATTTLRGSLAEQVRASGSRVRYPVSSSGDGRFDLDGAPAMMPLDLTPRRAP